MKKSSSAPLRLFIEVSDVVLADRLAAFFSGVPDLELVSSGDAADAYIVGPGRDQLMEVDNPLTPRELEVLTLLAEGASNKAIAHRLGISVHTAKFHVRSVLNKLDAVGRTDAVAHAARLGLIIL